MTDKEKKTKPKPKPKAEPKTKMVKTKAEPVGLNPTEPVVDPVVEPIENAPVEQAEELVTEPVAEPERKMLELPAESLPAQATQVRMVLLRQVGYLPAQSIVTVDQQTAQEYEKRGVARRKEI